MRAIQRKLTSFNLKYQITRDLFVRRSKIRHLKLNYMINYTRNCLSGAINKTPYLAITAR